MIQRVRTTAGTDYGCLLATYPGLALTVTAGRVTFTLTRLNFPSAAVLAGGTLAGNT